jgi:magnesium chelatase family protein
MLVAAMNPCPCGNFGSGKCICSPHKVRTYRQRISGPILERMDIQKFMNKVDLFEDTSARNKSEGKLAAYTDKSSVTPHYVPHSHTLPKNLNTESLNASAHLKKKVEKARAIQAERYKGQDGVWTNAQMDVSLIDRYCAIDEASAALIQSAHDSNQFSARSYHKILKVARTFADLDGAADIRREDVVSALLSRDLDRIDATPLKGW